MKRSFRFLLRDLLLYVVIALLLVTSIMALAVLTAKKGEPPNPFILNWLGLGGVMIVVYATAIHKYRATWSSMRFWSGIMLAMIAEIGIGILVLWGMPRISVLFWGLLVYPANAVTVDEFLTRWLGASRIS